VATTESVRLAELAASLSLATDIGLGVALEHAQRSAVLAVALADAAGVGADEARDAFYVALLKTVGCVGDEDFGMRVLGEDSGGWIAHMAGGSPAEFMAAMIKNIGRGDPVPRRIGRVLRAMGKGPASRRARTARWGGCSPSGWVCRRASRARSRRCSSAGTARAGPID